MQSLATNADTHMLPPRPRDGVVVLLVEDYEDCRDMYAVFLTMAGFRVLKAANGPEALAIARGTVPDLILMDLGLPGIDGCETTRRLKHDPVTSEIPVVALTAQCLPDEHALRTSGFEGVITKPCRPDELADRVAGVVRRTGRRAAR